jgi:adenylate cyclase, class 2
MNEPHRNVELKARDPSPARSLATCIALEARDHGTIWQRDTYFVVSHGRLKLREQEPGSPHLVQYERPDSTAEMPSDYRIVAVDDAAAIRAALSVALGIRGVVVKRRRLFTWRNVRIHLDDVEELGTFIEFEAVANPGSDLTLERSRVRELRQRFAIADEDLVAAGYVDQLAVG